MKDNLQAVAFATCLAAVCAGLLAAASDLLSERQEANAKAEQMRNIFKVLGITVADDADSKQLVALAKERVKERKVAGLKFYEYQHEKHGTLRAFEFTGPGLWGPVYGLLSLEDDLTTVFAVSFYKQEETPGLGGEIGKDDFQDLFRGKSVARGRIRLVRTGAKADDEVDAISGATMTCDKVDQMLAKVVGKIAAARSKIKGSGDGR